MTRHYWLLPLLFSVFYLLPLNGQLLWMPDETRYAEISREMLQEGEWIVPKLLGLRYFEKPVAGYWANNLSQWLLGESRFAVRCASALATGLSALLLYGMALQLWRCRRKAANAALIYLSSLLVLGIGTYAVLDALLAFWINLAMVSAYRVMTARRRSHQVIAAIGLGLSTGIAFLTKGFIAGAIVAVALLPYALWQGHWRVLLRYFPWMLLSLLLVSLPWVVAIARCEPDYWHYFFWVEHIQRFAKESAQHRQPCWFYLPCLLAGTLPWLGFLPAALVQGWRQRRRDPSYGYLLSWLVMPLLLLSIAKGKLITYMLPCFAPLSLLISSAVTDAVAAGGKSVLRRNALLNGLFATMVLVALLLFKHTTVWSQWAVYQTNERTAWLVATACFAGWLLLSLLAWTRSRRRWGIVAGGPLLLALLIPYALPQSIVNAKQPETFLQRHQRPLAGCHYILSNHVGLAVSAAWQLKRSDIMLLEVRGELAYGLDHADSGHRHLSRTQFAHWLATARAQGDVALLLHLEAGEAIDTTLPVADRQVHYQRLALLLYHQVVDPA